MDEDYPSINQIPSLYQYARDIKDSLTSQDQREDLENDFLPGIAIYLYNQLNPDTSILNLETNVEPEIRRLVFPIVDDYVSTAKDASDQIKQRQAQITTQRILEMQRGLGGQIDRGGKYSFKSVNYSDLPTLLAYYLGLLSTAYEYLVTSDPSTLRVMYQYPSEWRALIGAGLNLCDKVGGHSYMYWLISSIGQLGQAKDIINSEGQRRSIQPYWFDELYNALYNKKCTLNHSDLQEAIAISQHNINEIQEHYFNNVNAKRYASESQNLLDEIIAILDEIPRYQRNLIGGEIAMTGPRYTFPGGTGYLALRDKAQMHFQSQNPQTTTLLQRIQSDRNVDLDTLIRYAYSNNMIPYRTPNELAMALSDYVGELSTDPSEDMSLRQLFNIDDNITTQDYLYDWSNNIRNVTDWPILLKSANLLDVTTLPYTQPELRQYLLDYATQL